MDNVREKLVELLYRGTLYAQDCNRRDYDCYAYSDVADYLIEKGVTVQEQGQWTENQHVTYDSIWGEDVYWYTYTCSVCGGEAMNNSSYCPFCGNPMLPTPPKGE